MVTAMGFELVQLRMLGGARKTLQIMVEPIDHERSMTVENCADLSHAISAILDVEDPISGAYALEVSSPGIDRPLVKLNDFERFGGHLAKIELEQPVATAQGERRKFQGSVTGVRGELISILVEAETIDVAFGNIRKAKLVLTDELIKSHQKASKAGIVEAVADNVDAGQANGAGTDADLNQGA